MKIDSRLRSLIVVHTAVLLFTLGSSIIFTGVFPYLLQLDPTVIFDEYGLVVAADAFAQMIFSPLFGYIADKLHQIRIVAIVCSVLFISGNAFYSLLSLIPREVSWMNKPRLWFMLIARLVVGIGTSVNAAARLYIAKVTTLDERTTHVALLSLFQSLGFILGPALQAALSPIGEKDVPATSAVIFDMFTATGWVSVLNGVIGLCFFLPGIFVEYKSPTLKVGEFDSAKVKGEPPTTSQSTIGEATKHDGDDPIPTGMPISPAKRAIFGAEAAKARQKPREILKQYSRMSILDGTNLAVNQAADSEKKEGGCSDFQWPDMWAVSVCIYSFGAFFCAFVIIELLLTPISIHQFGWSDGDSILYNGLFLAGSGLLATFAFASIGPLSKRFDERLLLLFCGILPMTLSRFLAVPMSQDRPIFKGNLTVCEAEGYDVSDPNLSTDDDSGGCPFCWCLEQNQLKETQFMVSAALGVMAFPFCISIVGSLLTKVLGSIPQGLWMGVLTTSGGLARVLGPILFSRLYENNGLYWTFGLLGILMLSTFVLCAISYHRFKDPKATCWPLSSC